jgi:hypothetical protein
MRRVSQRVWFPALCFAVALLAVPARAVAQSPASAGIAVDVAGKTVTIAAARLAALPRDTVRGRIHGPEHVFTGPRLAAVLAEAGVNVNGLRGRQLTRAVVVEAADGYRAVLSIGELDTTLVARRAILADREDGAPLEARYGPWQVVLEGELRPTRWVRQVVSLRIVELGSADSSSVRPAP